jgi:hypothetical protein
VNKIEFKLILSEYRKIERRFRENMSRSNYPCGYDDMLYEQHEQAAEEWLERQHPSVVYAIQHRYD